MKNKWTWFALVLIVLVGVVYYFRAEIAGSVLNGQQANRAAAAENSNSVSTTTVRPATDSNQVSAAGNIEVGEELSAVLQVEGIVSEVAVEVGDEVSAGDLLLALETADLERAIQRAELELDVKQAQLDKLLEPAEPADIAAARANLASAQENLTDIQAGPSAAEVAAAEAALAAAQERYQELLNGKSEAELVQASVELHKSTIALKKAQDAYNEIAYRGDIGSTQQAIDLQTATIDYEAAKAAYEIATEPASQADLQDALKSIKDAEQQLDTLRRQPSQADMADAEANVAGAEAELSGLLGGPGESELREAELALQQVQVDLEEAAVNLSKARLRASIDGTVMAVEAQVGQQLSAGFEAIALADLTNLELTVNVAEVDISKVAEGQPAQITIDALSDQLFSGQVARIAPASDSEGGVVNYPVTIQLDKANLTGVRPGMTAVATIGSNIDKQEWLVPTNALQEFEGETTVTVVHNGRQTKVEVTPGSSQGEWTIVQSPELKAGDEVVGEVASFLDEDEGFGGARGPFGPPRR